MTLGTISLILSTDATSHMSDCSLGTAVNLFCFVPAWSHFPLSVSLSHTHTYSVKSLSLSQLLYSALPPPLPFSYAPSL